jgi:hypothetical protein
MTIPELVDWYRPRGYQFVAVGEHSQDMDEQKVQQLQEQCAAHSNAQFCIIPGIEYSCRDGIHIFGLGTVGLTEQVDPRAVVAMIHAQDGFAILAHPVRMNWSPPDELILAVDAVEIWNVSYDGKYLPSFRAPDAFRRMQQVNPNLRAIAGHDFHRKASFYDVGVEIEVGELSPTEVLKVIKQGRYAITSRFFRTDARARLSWASSISLRGLSRQLAYLRRARDILLRGSTA